MRNCKYSSLLICSDIKFVFHWWDASSRITIGLPCVAHWSGWIGCQQKTMNYLKKGLNFFKKAYLLIMSFNCWIFPVSSKGVIPSLIKSWFVRISLLTGNAIILLTNAADLRNVQVCDATGDAMKCKCQANNNKLPVVRIFVYPVKATVDQRKFIHIVLIHHNSYRLIIQGAGKH